MHLPRRIPRRTDLWPRAWRRQPLAAAAVLVLAIILAWTRARTPAGTDYDRYHNQTFSCLHAVDGDTIDIDIADTSREYTRIRLWGVDTPETGKNGTPGMYYGPEAAAFAHSLVDGRPVRIVLSPDKSRDKYGRLLAYVYLDASAQAGVADGGRMLNEELIAGGYGYADRRFAHVWRDRFNSLEEGARKQKLGLWKSVKREQMPAWRQKYESHKQANDEEGP